MFSTIVALQDADRDRVRDHLLRLSPADRSLRFAAGVVSDATLAGYAGSIDFQRDLVLGLISKRGCLVGLVHGCVYTVHGRRHVEAAFSVDADWRGRGFGTRLMEALQARIAGSGGATLVGSCSARNQAMRRVFQRTGLDLTVDDGEVLARLPLADSSPRCEVAAA